MLSHLLRALFMAVFFSSLWIMLFLTGQTSFWHALLGVLFLAGMLMFAAAPALFRTTGKRNCFRVMLVSWLMAAGIGTAWLVQWEIGALSPSGDEYRRIHSVLSAGGYWWYFAPSDPDVEVLGTSGLVCLVMTVLALSMTLDRLVEGWKRLKEHDPARPPSFAE